MKILQQAKREVAQVISYEPVAHGVDDRGLWQRLFLWLAAEPISSPPADANCSLFKTPLVVV